MGEPQIQDTQVEQEETNNTDTNAWIVGNAIPDPSEITLSLRFMDHWEFDLDCVSHISFYQYPDKPMELMLQEAKIVGRVYIIRALTDKFGRIFDVNFYYQADMQRVPVYTLKGCVLTKTDLSMDSSDETLVKAEYYISVDKFVEYGIVPAKYDDPIENSE
jgi:hypothetical protein